MVFSSISFLFFFLPILFFTYHVVPKSWKNGVLLLFSLLFYFFGEKWYVLLLLFTCVANYICGRAIGKRSHVKLFLISGLTIDLGMLFYFKYANFFLNAVLSALGLKFRALRVVLPLGISFFTFQNVSYLIDVYRCDVKEEKNFLTYLSYITLFPQLVAGPIIRYKDVAEELSERFENTKLLASGIKKFVIGLAKKVLIADVIYSLASQLMNYEMTVLSYWVVAIMFTLQIYYDFSGYSDMAIGLGRMFGFQFAENFDYPFTAKSVSDFWHRWHISLSRFFKDYVYIPLGGNRVSVPRCILNLLIVWFLTGLWHGADWNYILWGLYFFFFLVFEKYIVKDKIKSNVLSHVFTLLIIIISFVIFTLSDLGELTTFLKGMIGIDVKLIDDVSIQIVKNSIVVIIISCVGSLPWLKIKIEKLKKGKLNKVVEFGEVIYIMVLFIFSVSAIVSSSFSPFIYFRF